MNYYDDYVKHSSTFCICCHKGVNLGSFAAFCKEESTDNEAIFRFYIEDGMHDSDVGDMKAIVQEYFPNPIFEFIPDVPAKQIDHIVAYALKVNAKREVPNEHSGVEVYVNHHTDTTDDDLGGAVLLADANPDGEIHFVDGETVKITGYTQKGNDYEKLED